MAGHKDDLRMLNTEIERLTAENERLRAALADAVKILSSDIADPLDWPDQMNRMMAAFQQNTLRSEDAD